VRVVRTLDELTGGRPFAVTIGAFDGVHLGHQSLFAQLRQQALLHRANTLAITFDPDPAEVVSPDPPPHLTDLEQRIELIERQGMDELCILHFDRAMMALSAEQFMDQLLSHARVAELVVGHDFAMGHDRLGTHSVLAAYARRHDFAFAMAEAFMLDGAPVSASRIRRLLLEGDVTMAAELLGRNHTVRGRVVEGDKRGRQIGFPTANLGLDQRWAIPADGVYVARTHVRGRWYPSAVNIGLRPTFDLHQRTIESHLIDFSGDIYGEPIAVEFAARLRAEQRFSGLKAIRAQIARDVEAARDFFQRDQPLSS